MFRKVFWISKTSFLFLNNSKIYSKLLLVTTYEEPSYDQIFTTMDNIYQFNISVFRQILGKSKDSKILVFSKHLVNVYLIIIILVHIWYKYN